MRNKTRATCRVSAVPLQLFAQAILQRTTGAKKKPIKLDAAQGLLLGTTGRLSHYESAGS
jgi:hypothetical protein